MTNKLKVAILSPGVDVYSETFILNHKEKINADIFFYYDGPVPTKLEGGVDPEDIVLSESDDNLSLNEPSIAQLYKLKQSLEDNDIDVVLCEYGVTAASSLPAIKALGLPLVVHFHGYDAYKTDVLQKHREEYKDVFEYASQIVAVSQAMHQQLISIGCPENKLIHAPCGAKKMFFTATVCKGSQQFLSAGRFVQKKAPYYTILAFNEVTRTHPNASLVMAADGPFLDVCRNMAVYCGIEDRVTFLGPVSNEKILAEMERSLALVQHSITAPDGDSEGTPVAVVEAGAAGLPVIATRHAGIPEVVIEGTTGLLIDEHDVIGMANAMRELLDNPKRAQKLGNNARNHVKKNFGEMTSIRKLEKAIAFAKENKTLKDNIDSIHGAALRNPIYHKKFLQRQSEYLKKKNEYLEKEIANIKSSIRWQVGDRVVSSSRRLLAVPIRVSKAIRKNSK